MNSLLKRQIRKFLPKEFQSNSKLDNFLDAINRSYTTSEEQFTMLQRATTISSEELFTANQKLKEESDSQKKIIDKLKNLIDTLKFYDLEEDQLLESSDSLKLVDFIDNQTKEIIKINKQKDKLVESLERQNQELNDYAHMVSHDLKSPLQSIDALTTWVIDDYSEVLDASGKETLELIRDNVEKMDTLVKGILQYSTIDKIEKELYDVSLNILVNNIINNLDQTENVSFIIPNKLPIIKGDNYRLEQLFSHLINNAIKFNDKKQISIEIGFTEESNYWKFYIKDNGKGIEKKYFDKIFVAFQKLEDNYQSSGIGLSIVKKIVELYKGEIYLQSTLNEGSTFYFSIKK
ncbi:MULTISPECIES: sensor histidine kinase [Tenacibaculum]|uniref:sensor histidine kinase n=1 Tax=Tenacibaculum TaxID=104267 RepID=UPI001F0A4FBA|nr:MULTISPECIES: ATP-binding protein [Tenacibaculum]MCH3882206.1 ATP-binding protein [Tenacibaculum aquimarinum]MDO6599839.1 ATP-binding protein [Tenacibaculum sp. 1_MG-2023]